MRVLAIVTAALAFVATDAQAEIVVFKNGRSMSVKSVRLEAELATMVLRQGGEVTFPSGIIARIDPDEMPFESPEDPEATAIRLAQDTAPDHERALVSDAVLAARPF